MNAIQFIQRIAKAYKLSIICIVKYKNRFLQFNNNLPILFPLNLHSRLPLYDKTFHLHFFSLVLC